MKTIEFVSLTVKYTDGTRDKGRINIADLDEQTLIELENMFDLEGCDD
jgi:hypothetical protein